MNPCGAQLSARLEAFREFVTLLERVAPPAIRVELPERQSRGVKAAGVQADAALRIGDFYSFSGVADRKGWLHLISLGTDGHVLVILCGARHLGYIERGERFTIPSERFLSATTHLRIKEPRTSHPNQLDRILVVVTEDKIELKAHDLSSSFQEAPASDSDGKRGAPPAGGFGGTPRSESPLLLRLLREDKASYGLLHLQIIGG